MVDRKCDLIHYRKLLNGSERCHVGEGAGRLQVRHRFQRVDARHVGRAEDAGLQKCSHAQRTRQSLTGEISSGRIDVAGSMIGEIFTDQEDQIHAGLAGSGRIDYRRSKRTASASSQQDPAED